MNVNEGLTMSINIDRKLQCLGAPRRQAGFNLLEVMISLGVLALGLAGIAALLIQGMTTSNSATLNSVAVAHAQTGAEMMRGNLEAYTVGWYFGGNTSGTAPTAVTCTGACSEADQANNDFAKWRELLATSMPDGSGVICTDSTPDDGQPGAPACDGDGTNVIKIFWRDANDADSLAVVGSDTHHRFVTTVSP